MGGGPSKTRKLTVENDDPTSVIKVSEDVVERIRGNQIDQVVRQEQMNSGFSSGPLYLNEPSLTSLQLRQANVIELKKNDDYWENRLKNLEANHKKMNEIMEAECTKAVEEIRGKKKVSSNSIIKPPCLDQKKAVTECYQYYPNEPMKCAKIVQAFQECVDLKRTCLIESRG